MWQAERSGLLFARFLCCVLAASVASCGLDGGSSTPAYSQAAELSISGAPSTQVQAGKAYSFQPSVASSAGPVGFNIRNRPAWATFSATTGQLTGTPSSSDVGNYTSIEITATDGAATVSLPTFSISVVRDGTGSPPPVLSISGTPPAQAQAGKAYSFQPSIASSGGTIAFSIQNQPAWATFSATTGQLMGTPSISDVGTYASIEIIASDGATTVSLPRFSITVAPSAPVQTFSISGTPATQVQAGTAYSFQPTVKSDGGIVGFSIKNKPAWATFSVATGQLSGTPGSANVGTYSNINITATDGAVAASLPSFSITVKPRGTVTLNWNVPTSNTNGTPLTDLASYTIDYGTSSSALNQSIAVSDPAATTYTFRNLTSGTWYFAITAVTSDGTQSALSNVVATTLQ